MAIRDEGRSGFPTLVLAGLLILSCACSEQREPEVKAEAELPSRIGWQVEGKAAAPDFPATETHERAEDAIEDGPYWIGFEIAPRPQNGAVRSAASQPCGEVTKGRVSAIPDFPEADPLRTSAAIEFDDKGKTIRTWRLPNDSRLAGVDGDSLLVSIAMDPPADQYWVALDGRLSRPRHRVDLSSGRLPSSQCPGFITWNATCHIMVDPQKARLRYIAIEDVCR